MKGLTLSDRARYYQPCTYTHPSSPNSSSPSSSDNTICARLRRVFKGPPHRQSSTKNLEWKDEKKYHHVPTHARASFMKTATSPVMLAPMEEGYFNEKAARGEASLI